MPSGHRDGKSEEGMGEGNKLPSTSSRKRGGVCSKAIIGSSWATSFEPARQRLAELVEWKNFEAGKTSSKFSFDGDWGLFEPAVREKWTLIEEAYQQAEWAGKQIRKVKPDLVVVWNDFQPFEVGLVLAAKAKGIPTVVTAHGSMLGLNPGGFGNDTCADYELGTWATRQMFKDFDAEIDSIPVGMPLLDPWAKAAEAPIRESARTDLGIKVDKPVVTWIGTWSASRRIWDQDELNYFLSFLNSFKALKEIVPGIQLNICPHPRSGMKNSQYQTLVEDFGITEDYLILSGGTELAVASSELLVGARSSAMTQGLMCGVPSIVLDYKPWHEWTWFRGKGFEIVETASQLTGTLVGIFADPNRYVKLRNGCSVGAEWFASTPDGNAGMRMARTLERLATGKEIDELCQAPLPQ